MGTLRQSVPCRAPEAPAHVSKTLSSPGRPLDGATRSTFEARFDHDFRQVRVHTGPDAQHSARELGASAYAAGRHLVFGPDRYRPDSPGGRQLLAHELTHVVQSRSAPDVTPSGWVVSPPGSAPEREARHLGPKAATGLDTRPRARDAGPTIFRASPDAVRQTLAVGRAVGAAIQFFPTNVTDTQVGPVTVRGGLLSSGRSRLQVFVGENLTPRILAREILPLWNTATPFTPPGAAAPLPLTRITEEQLAQGLLVYNQYYVPVPAMTRWRAGLRFPLPVEIDETTGMGTLHPDLIVRLASAFDPAWTPLLDQRAPGVAAPPAATVQAEVTAFLARETTPLARGIHLGARAVTNAMAELPFLREAFRQLGGDGFEVALHFMDHLVNREIALLAAQRDGAAILGLIRTALAAVPASPTAEQTRRLTRAQGMLGRVAGVAAQNPSAAAPTRAEKTVTIDTIKLAGSSHNPAADVDVANAIYAQCNVRFQHGIDESATLAETQGWLGGDTALHATTACGRLAEERTLFAGATARFGLTARMRAFFVETISARSASGYSFPRYCATGAAATARDHLIVENSGDTSTLGHELGHILLNSGRHPANTLMGARPRPVELTDPQCATIYRNA